MSRRSKEVWHYKPDVPITPSPYFNWPLDISSIAKWMVHGWLPVSERLIILLLSLLTVYLFTPALENAQDFSIAWVAQMYARNLILMAFVAGGLHYYFYILKAQGDERRYDTRPFSQQSRVFTFGSQVRDNMFWTMGSGVLVWTAYECGMYWALANGFTPALNLPNDMAWLVLFIFLLPVWETTHFFLIHRLIHWAPFYQRIHALHHRNTNVGPWSGLSMHPLEHIIYLSTVLIHFIITSSPLLITFHLAYFTLSAATTHTGYQGVVWRKKLIFPLGTFHHQLHHRYFECNYGGLEAPWDKWTGSFHDGTEESHNNFLARRKEKIKR